MLIVFEVPTVVFVVLNPRYRNTKTSPGLASIAYFPSKSVSTPLEVPSMITLTPGKTPETSETIPEIIFSCAEVICTVAAIMNIITSLFTFINF